MHNALWAPYCILGSRHSRSCWLSFPWRRASISMGCRARCGVSVIFAVIFAVVATTASSSLHADVAVSVGTPGTVVNTSSGASYINVPVNVDLTNGGTMESLTLACTYNSSLLSLSTSSVTIGSIGNISSSWAPTAYIPTPGTVVVTEAATSYVQAPLATSVFYMDFRVNQGVSGYIPISFATPYSDQTITDAFGNDLPVTEPLTTSFTNGGINTTNASSGTATWTSSISGSWSTASNWSNGPPTSGQMAALGGSLSSSLTVSLNGPQAAGGITFSNSSGSATGYQITPGVSGSGTLTLNNSGTTIPLQVLSGSNSISAPIILAGNLAISESAGSWLDISGNISQSTTAGLTLSGKGHLILSGSDSYTGGTTLTGGTLDVVAPHALPAGGGLSVGNATVILDRGTQRDR